MKKRSRKGDIEKGKFLIASPGLVDPNFRRTVVLLCDHGPHGSLGLVINRPTEVPLAKACPEIDGATERTEVLHQGGPVQPSSLLVLHRLESPAEGDLPVVEGVHLGGNKELLARLFRSPPRGERALFRCYLGYAGWGAGQLAFEVAQGAWIIAPADLDLVFDAADPSGIWPGLMRRLGGVYSIFAEIPEDPELN